MQKMWSDVHYQLLKNTLAQAYDYQDLRLVSFLEDALVYEQIDAQPTRWQCE
jgi:hypothetical protein